MKYKGIEIRTAVVHDFTKNEEELWSVTFMESREEYLKSTTLEQRVSDMFTLAEETNNRYLQKAIMETFNYELGQWLGLNN